MVFLVTGASGYVGGRLVKELSERGLKTRAFVRSTSNVSKIKSLKNVEIFYGDLGDFASLVYNSQLDFSAVIDIFITRSYKRPILS